MKKRIIIEIERDRRDVSIRIKDDPDSVMPSGIAARIDADGEEVEHAVRWIKNVIRDEIMDRRGVESMATFDNLGVIEE